MIATSIAYLVHLWASSPAIERWHYVAFIGALVGAVLCSLIQLGAWVAA